MLSAPYHIKFSIILALILSTFTNQDIVQISYLRHTIYSLDLIDFNDRMHFIRTNTHTFLMYRCTYASPAGAVAIILNASELLLEVRSRRRLSMNTLADVSGVPVSTISRIESGKVEPTWAMMSRILTAAGFHLEPHLSDAGTDEPIAGIIRRLNDALPEERARVVGRFPSVARLALVARRNRARRVRLVTKLDETLGNLTGQDQSPVVSSL